MKDGDITRSTFNGLVGRFVKISEQTGYIESVDDSAGRWKTPECTIKDILKYWKVIISADDKDTLPFG
jgi:hypothetical protein